MQLSDRTTGAGLMVLGGLATWGGSRLPGVPGQDVGPAVFPMVIGVGLALCGALIALGVGRGFEASEDTAGHKPGGGLRVLLPPAVLLFYVLAVERIGFLPTAALLVAVVAFALGAGWRLALPLAVLAPLAIHAVFSKLLRVPLPDGWVPAPW